MTRQHAAITVYWRPGCPYCARLLADLDKVDLPIRKVNIWADPDAAATVRMLADGNETVPTVVVSGRGMVNPRAADVLDAVCDNSPDLLDGVDTAAVTSGPWWVGLLVTLAAAVGWFVLATGTPTTTYHFAPAVVVAAWPVRRRLRAGRALRGPAAGTATAGGALVALVTTGLLAAVGALAGPTLFGIPTASTETLAAILVGAAAGAGLAVVGGRRTPPS